MVCQFLFIVKAQRASIAFEITLKKFCLLLLFLLCPLFGMFQSHMLVQVFVQPVGLVARNTLEKLILIGTIAIFISLNTTFRNMFIFFFLVLWTGSIFFESYLEPLLFLWATAANFFGACAIFVEATDWDLVSWFFSFLSIGSLWFRAGFAGISPGNLRTLLALEGVRIEESVLFWTEQESIRY